MSDIKEHKRVNDILLGPLERPALAWLAEHMPAWATPDLMTVIGIIGALVIALGYGLSRVHPAFLWLATIGFVINWFGDSLDGTLARYRHIERPKYGFFIDHITDCITEIVIVLSLGLTFYISFPVAAMCCIAYIAMSVLVYVRMNVMGEFKISYGKLGPTEIRVLAILLNTAMFAFGIQKVSFSLASVSTSLSVYDIVVFLITMLLIYFFADTSFRQASELRKLGE